MTLEEALKRIEELEAENRRLSQPGGRYKDPIPNFYSYKCSKIIPNSTAKSIGCALRELMFDPIYIPPKRTGPLGSGKKMWASGTGVITKKTSDLTKVEYEQYTTAMEGLYQYFDSYFSNERYELIQELENRNRKAVDAENQKWGGR